jgi:hypothetical protein
LKAHAPRAKPRDRERAVDRLERLEAIEEIRRLKARYFRAMDRKLWDELPALFAPDLKIIGEDGSIFLEGGNAFAASLKRSLEHSVSVHQGFSPEIEIDDADTARGIWPMQDIISWADRHPRTGWKSILGRGHYHETYRRIDGRWRIATLQLIRLRLDVTWPDDRAEESAA